MFGDEGIELSKLGVSLLLLAAVVGYVLFNVIIGRIEFNNYFDTIENRETAIVSQEFLAFSDWKEVPIASAYALVTYYDDDIESITCYIEDNKGLTYNNVDESCIRNHLTGLRCLVKATPSEEASTYKIEIKPVS